MKDRLQKLFEDRRPAWLTPHMVGILLVLALLLTTLAWSGPISHNRTAQEPVLAPQSTSTTVGGLSLTPAPSPSPLPLEWVQNSENTNDIVLVGILLVVIVIGGTYNAIRQSKIIKNETNS